ncbi:MULTISPECIES: F0F1 ATP synthase subunit B family protein [Acidiphilium]|uniref:ATP synthase subunit b n=1 Tax=Acidiphilium multivorum (strain DSM 11245 / JCM 8867 / NBRC 100883 / AIU 301) TaxID=926570 RepID=F0J3I1_ACIMA|nr:MULTISPECIES: ATP synthase subunit B [Acidiphilium]MBS3024386.1 F0F1 ATP synthase subunit B [Acidiphilium multivorum]UNC13124.1 F0F1 ATP synthase subunit B [Acidiphilium multivorum]BAJ79837.1 ATP synthase subunit b' [Acidiphilium multivorum AIU301]GAN73620.1 ATP synthase F0 subunit beta' [Acidiphilium multivorum AIU301]
MRRTTILLAATALGLTPATAMAEGKMPQMDFSNPLTGAQVVWMAVIMVVLYFVLARWALPRIGGVIENRHNRIATDLETARRAKAEAEHAVRELNLAIQNARESSQGAIAEAVNAAKERARAQTAALNDRLSAQIASAEAEIDSARRTAVGALAPIARDVASSLLHRLIGEAVEPGRIEQAVSALSTQG